MIEAPTHGAQILSQNNVFEDVQKAFDDTDTCYAVSQGNDLGGGSNTAPYVLIPIPVDVCEQVVSILYRNDTLAMLPLRSMQMRLPPPVLTFKSSMFYFVYVYFHIQIMGSRR